MRSILLSSHSPRRASAARGCLVLALVLAWTQPVGAATAGPEPATVAAPVPLLADFDIVSYFSGVSSRSNVVRLCIIVLALALFIMMKKFEGAELGQRSGGRAREPKPGERHPTPTNHTRGSFDP